ncbi:type II secretion system F family protein [Patescibacteria group bacterium AH-259-L05]|nr:type II secretion system F family protein [Patescibacteria group bacterium AH-259-L05]
MLFEYKVKNLKGETVEGTIEAASQKAALDVLTARKMIIISLKESGELPFWRRPLNISFLQRATPKDMVFLSRQLSVMVSAGLPLVKSLEVVARQTQNQYLKTVMNSIAADVRGGARFSTSLAKYPKAFDDFYINMVRAGETAGKLDEVLDYLANEQEKNYDLTSKIQGAMIYPAFVVVAVGGVMTLMMVFVIPQLTKVLQEAGVSLPKPTRMLIATSQFFQAYFIFIVLFVIAAFIFLRFFFTKTSGGKLLWDKTLIKLPVFGELFQKVYLIRFTRSLSTLIVGGIPISSGLKIVAGVVGNSVYKNTILNAVVDVEEGRSISSSFMDAKHIPQLISNLMAIGEQTGRLDEVLGKVADFYSREVENMLAKLVTLLEPIIIIFLGVVVGGMIAAIILPMYKLASAF